MLTASMLTLKCILKAIKMFGTGTRDQPFVIDDADSSGTKAAIFPNKAMLHETVSANSVILLSTETDNRDKAGAPTVIDLTADDDDALAEVQGMRNNAITSEANKKRKRPLLEKDKPEGARNLKRARPQMRTTSDLGRPAHARRRRNAAKRGREELRQEMSKEASRAKLHAFRRFKKRNQKQTTIGRGPQATYQRAMECARLRSPQGGDSKLRRDRDQRPPETVLLDRQLIGMFGDIFG